MAQYEWEMSQDNFWLYITAAKDIIAATQRQDAEALAEAKERIMLLPGYPAENDWEHDIIMISVPSTTMVQLGRTHVKVKKVFH